MTDPSNGARGVATREGKELNEPRQDQTEPSKREGTNDAIACPVCGAATVQEKCKVICKSDLCRGRVIYNCAEF